jgi:hypothetical protein
VVDPGSPGGQGGGGPEGTEAHPTFPRRPRPDLLGVQFPFGVSLEVFIARRKSLRKKPAKPNEKPKQLV